MTCSNVDATVSDPGDGARKIILKCNSAASVGAPAAGFAGLYCGVNDELMFRDSASGADKAILRDGVPVTFAQGGHGQTSQTAGFDALSPATTDGDLVIYNGADNVRLGIGSAGQRLAVVAGRPAWAWPSVVFRTTDNTLSNTAAADDAQMTLAVSASTNYAVEGELYVNVSTAVPDPAFGLNVPASATFTIANWYAASGAGQLAGQTTTDSGTTTFNFTAATDSMVRFSAFISVAGTTTGGITLYWGTTGATGNAILKKGSWMRITPVA